MLMANGGLIVIEIGQQQYVEVKDTSFNIYMLQYQIFLSFYGFKELKSNFI